MHKRKRDENATFSRFYTESKVAKNTYNFRYLSVSLLGNSVGIKQLLQQQLLALIDLLRAGIAPVYLPSGTELVLETIPLHRLSDDTCVVYRSAIALKLASLWQLNSLDIANQLVASLPTTSQDTASQSGLDFGVEVVPPGWINFRLSDPGLATWLQQMIQIPPSKGEGEGEQGRGDVGNSSGVLSTCSSPVHPKDVPNLFPVQYAHARCCSLLHLAHWQGLIKLQDLDFKSLSWQLVEPNPIPWLDDQGTDTEQAVLRLVHPTERRLITELLDFQAAISDSDQLSLVKLGNSLSKAFEQFYSSCRILGEVKTQNPRLAQARLGLVGITQAMLRSLLEDQLGVSAPVEL